MLAAFLSSYSTSDFHRGHCSQLTGAEGAASGLLQEEDLGGTRGFPAICSRTWQALIAQVPEVPAPKGGTGPRLTLIMEITLLLALLS